MIPTKTAATTVPKTKRATRNTGSPAKLQPKIPREMTIEVEVEPDLDLATVELAVGPDQAPEVDQAEAEVEVAESAKPSRLFRS